jgi:hypothetical protein
MVLEQLCFVVLSKRSRGEEMTEFSSEKHSHLPQDCLILTFFRAKGRQEKAAGRVRCCRLLYRFGTQRAEKDDLWTLFPVFAPTAWKQFESSEQLKMRNAMEKPGGTMESLNAY